MSGALNVENRLRKRSNPPPVGKGRGWPAPATRFCGNGCKYARSRAANICPKNGTCTNLSIGAGRRTQYPLIQGTSEETGDGRRRQHRDQVHLWPTVTTSEVAWAMSRCAGGLVVCSSCKRPTAPVGKMRGRIPATGVDDGKQGNSCVRDTLGC